MTRRVTRRPHWQVRTVIPGPAPTPPAPFRSSGLLFTVLDLLPTYLGSALSHTFLAFFIQQSSFVLPPFLPKETCPSPPPPRLLAQGKLRTANQQILGQTTEAPPTIWRRSEEANISDYARGLSLPLSLLHTQSLISNVWKRRAGGTT